MRIVIDLIRVQTNKHIEESIPLLLAMIKNIKEYEICLALNSTFPKSIKKIRNIFKKNIPQNHICICTPPSFLDKNNQKSVPTLQISELITEYFLEQLNPDIILTPSFIEKYDNNTKQFSTNETAIQMLKSIDYILKENKVDIRYMIEVKTGTLSPSLHKDKNISKDIFHHNSKKTLAYFSPLPPQRSGISDYSKELLPYLASHYKITIITNGDDNNIFKDISIPTQDISWFYTHAHKFDRILYHIGNNTFHTYMVDILKVHTGVVMLHDFFLSNLYYDEEHSGNRKDFWNHALLHSHGFNALKERVNDDHHQHDEQTKQKYPSNIDILQNAKSLIFHSHHSNFLLDKYYGVNHNVKTFKVSFLKEIPQKYNKTTIRHSMKYHEDDFIVCSFGFLSKRKLNHKLLEAWEHSKLSKLKNCKLIFVGTNDAFEYGQNILKQISQSKNITITGWTNDEQYTNYLKIADVGVQLREESRGETSAAIHDCMAYGLATICNENGSFIDLARNSVSMIDDKFKIITLSNELEKLYDDSVYRNRLSKNAIELIKTQHSPQLCAKMYFDAIEASYQKKDMHQLLSNIVKLDTFASIKNNEITLLSISKTLAKNIVYPCQQKQLLVDVSAIYRNDLKTGIERVVRAQLLELIKQQPIGYKVEAIYLDKEDDKWSYRYAKDYTLSLLGIKDVSINNTPIDIFNGDIYYCADFFRDGIIESIREGLIDSYKAKGVSIYFLIYDLLPITNPKFFPKGSDIPHLEWLNSISTVADNLICISQTVAEEVKKVITYPHKNIIFNHLGADLLNAQSSHGLTENSKEVIHILKSKITFLMVGTIEPRKGYLQVLSAFEILWSQGIDVNLVIVGKEGWKGLFDIERRTIPQIIKKMRKLILNQNKFHWLENISDEYLEEVYNTSSCVIIASEGEGFGLPLIEAAQHSKPIIARDIPVFKEVAGNYAYYFKNEQNTQVIIKSIIEWLKLYKDNTYQKSDNIPWKTWSESTSQLLEILQLQE